MDYLAILESEAIYLLREAAAAFHRPALLFSGGKDSTVLLHLARKAFYPSKIPLQLIHIDTGHNFEEVIVFRDSLAQRLNLELKIGSVESTIAKGLAKEAASQIKSRNAIQSVTLMELIREYSFDCLIGGARRDEEKARAKERIFSTRNEFGQWNPRQQRVEISNLYNYKLDFNEHMRCFPLSNWTEKDIWEYVIQDSIELPLLYFSHQRPCVRFADGSLFPASPYLNNPPDSKLEFLRVRCRTVGDMLSTGLIESTASNPKTVLEETLAMGTSERSLRWDDKSSETSMEDRKREGYF